MKGRLGVFACALIVSLLLAPARAAVDPLPRSTPESVGLNAAKLAEATALLKQYVADRKIAGAVAAVARKGKLAYLEAVGVQDLASQTRMTDRSLFRIYSMTKSVTAVAVMMLLDEGKSGLSEPVSKYLPEFRNVRVGAPDGGARPPSREITIEDLLLHTSGLNHRTSEEYRRAKVRSRAMTLPQFVDNVVRVPLMEDPGTRYRYSESPTVLGRLVEIWSGKPFDVFLNERVFGPMKMSDTTFWAAADARQRLTTVYAPAQGGGLMPVELEDVPFSERPALLEGAVGLLSTVPDYLRFSQMLLNRGELEGKRILKAGTVDAMTMNHLSPKILEARGGGMGWGLANVNVVLNPAAVNYPAGRHEYGWDGTAGTIFWVDPHLQMVTILMTQSSPANPDSLRQRFKTLVQQSIIQ